METTSSSGELVEVSIPYLKGPCYAQPPVAQYVAELTADIASVADLPGIQDLLYPFDPTAERRSLGSIVREFLESYESPLDRAVADVIIERDALRKELEERPSSDQYAELEKEVAMLRAQVAELEQDKRTLANGTDLAIEPALLLLTGYGRWSRKAGGFERLPDFMVDGSGTRSSLIRRGDRILVIQRKAHSANAQDETEMRRLEVEIGNIRRKLAKNLQSKAGTQRNVETLAAREDKGSVKRLEQARVAAAQHDKEREVLEAKLRPLVEEAERLKKRLDPTESILSAPLDLSTLRVVLLEDQ